MIWTNRVSLAEASPRDWLNPGGETESWPQGRLLGPGQTDATAGSGGRAGEKRQPDHFWHFNIETMTSGNNSKNKIQDHIELSHPPESHAELLPPVSPRSTTELKSLFKAPKPVQTRPSRSQEPQAALSPLLGPRERRVPGKAPRSSRRAATAARAGHRAPGGRQLAVSASARTRGDGTSASSHLFGTTAKPT